MARHRGGNRPTPAPERPVPVAELIEQLRAERRQREQQVTEWRWFYRCTWVDDATGAELGQVYHSVDVNSPTNYQRASAQARREILADVPRYIAERIGAARSVSFRCQRVGQPVGIVENPGALPRGTFSR